MKVLVVGSGGREHVICWKLKQTGKVDELYCAPGNGGIASVATCVDIKASEVDKITDYAVDNKFDLVVVAPEDPLALGLVDKLNAKGIRAFGPSAKAAVIEASKAFSKKALICSISDTHFVSMVSVSARSILSIILFTVRIVDEP